MNFDLIFLAALIVASSSEFHLTALKSLAVTLVMPTFFAFRVPPKLQRRSCQLKK